MQSFARCVALTGFWIVALLSAALVRAEDTLEAPDRPLEALPYTPSLDVAAMDRSVDPCEDLYTYACGGWQKTHPIPADQASWDVYNKVTNDNLRYLWGILETLSKSSAVRTASQQKIGDYFAACMNETAIERAGHQPIDTYLARVAALRSKHELGALVGDLHYALGASAFFAFATEQDARDATQEIVGVYAGGLGLPDRDYYLKTDAKSKEIRERYLRHVENVFVLLGESASQARADAAIVMQIETALARATLTKVEKRDPYKVYHRDSPAGLQKLTPQFNWTDYFAHYHVTPPAVVNVSEPVFMRAFNALLKRESLTHLQIYLRWMLTADADRYLSQAFVDESFAFYSAYLRGVPTQRPRWKKCVSLVDRDLGDALGQEFVERNFPATVKARTIRMTEQIERAMRARIEALEWMSAATKQQALDKLSKMGNKIGYPDLWRDYSSLQIRSDDFFGNLVRANQFEVARQNAKIGKPVDRNEWEMSAPTVNAYYNPQLNDVNFPAGVLLPPLFDPQLDDAPNYGNTGATIGHELTHGFDDEGRQFDGNGNLRDWWGKQDAKEFEKRAQCVRDQYSQYTIVDNLKINGSLTSGEDIADLGGLIVAWLAWQEQTRNVKLEPRDDLTPEQRFFVGFAQWACSNTRPEESRINAIVNPHSPDKYRINGVVVNMPEFAKAFACKPGQALVKRPADVCGIW